MENIQIRDFKYNPELRRLLVEYCLVVYEENAILNDENLIAEYNYLLENNKLNEIFNCEYLTIKTLQNNV
ncbi:hypothetical protein [Flavobacterium okayamense]|uniref:Uncharacterized protein n=1 Tax=Flavobacterium okayamense TaxID=2830782 RepID=A0ABM7S860_9FLAO|nr:hypothetical protein [Flavobacterium okayamense]BCY29685.1 hypothetical protein KK2020170_25530 [Flavobacterium okayamense]